MSSVNLKEARRRLGALVRAAARGKAAIITVRGKEAARIGPVEPKPVKKLPDLTEFRRSIALKGKPMSATVIKLRRKERF